jgi:signal transduction histidine kinase
MILLFAVVLLVNYLQDKKVKENSRWFTHSEEVLRNSANLQKHILDVQANYRGYMLSGSESNLTDALIARKKSDSLFLVLQKITADNVIQQNNLNAAGDFFDAWKLSWDKTISANRQYYLKSQAFARGHLPEWVVINRGKIISRIKEKFEKFDQEEYLLRGHREQALESARKKTNFLTITLGISAMLIVIVTATLISLGIRKRIHTLADATRSIAAGQYNFRIKDHSRDELRQLSDSINKMTRSLQQTIQSLKQKNEDLEQFAWISSHDLKEPLRMISIYSQKLGERFIGSEDPEAKMEVRFITAGVKKMYDLIDASMKYALMGTTDYEFEKLSTKEIIAESLENIDALIKETKAKINLEDVPEYITGIKTLMIELFQNLVENAIKFRGTNVPEIEIRARKDQDKWIFTVRDNGIGIDEKYKDHVFMIFHQLAKKSLDYDGIGIGLTYCKKIVEIHNGKIWLQSQPGKGTTFYFTIAETILKYKDTSRKPDLSPAP